VQQVVRIMNAGHGGRFCSLRQLPTL
jgi:hypothetical protein